MNREEEIQKAEDEFEFGYPLGVKHDSVVVKESFTAGAMWADSHPSLELVEKIINLSFNGWDGIKDFHNLAQSIKEEIENEIP
jgi:hypothetical protein